jgi:hypothetical protein
MFVYGAHWISTSGFMPPSLILQPLTLNFVIAITFQLVDRSFVFNLVDNFGLARVITRNGQIFKILRWRRRPAAILDF